jgi:thymidylate synthase
MQKVSDIRRKLIEKYIAGDFVVDKTGVKTVELIGESFIADTGFLIREPNMEYVDRELEWYKSQSLHVADIPGQTPKIWEQVSSSEGKINSNYGFLIWSKENGYQYENTKIELLKNPNSRRAIMIYNRPTMHSDYCENGMSDFICTVANSFFIRDNKLVSHYLIRSNDSTYGYGNDFHWAKYVQNTLANDLNIEAGDLIWTASSLHVYERDFKFLRGFVERGEF